MLMTRSRQFAATPSGTVGTDEIYFDVRWSHWLARTIPGTKHRVEISGGRIFFPEEPAAEFNAALRSFWSEWP
jgi:pimeloyl-ACP methyl ester carboxylesterase